MSAVATSECSGPTSEARGSCASPPRRWCPRPTQPSNRSIALPPPRPQRRGGFVSAPRLPRRYTMQVLRTAADRGHVKTGWLDSHHTFSFGHYHDPSWMGWGPLRVINEDRVAPGAGFPPHGHAKMEIISYVLEGGLASSDKPRVGQEMAG